MSDFVAIDVETANAFMGSICQVGAVRFENGREVDAISWLVDPRDDFDALNISIHGIDPAKVRGQPHFGDRYAQLNAFVGDSITVCHTHFDRVSIAQACSLWRTQELRCQWLDSARVARRVWSDIALSGYGLASLADRLGITFRHHDALEDARAAGLILLRAMEDSGMSIADCLKRVNLPISPDREDVRRTGDDDGPLVGHSIVFTGALEMFRADAADRAHELGAAVEAGVTKRTTMLVVGNQDLSRLGDHAKSSKHRKAEALIAKGQQIRIVVEGDFLAF